MNSFGSMPYWRELITRYSMSSCLVEPTRPRSRRRRPAGVGCAGCLRVSTSTRRGARRPRACPRSPGDALILLLDDAFRHRDLDDLEQVIHRASRGPAGLARTLRDRDLLTQVLPQLLQGVELAGRWRPRWREDSTVTADRPVGQGRELPRSTTISPSWPASSNTLEELRENLREQVAISKRYEQGQQAREKLMDHLLEVVEIPGAGRRRRGRRSSRHLGERGQSSRTTSTAPRSTSRPASSVRTNSCWYAVAEARPVSRQQQELIEYLVMSSRQYGMDPNEFIKAVRRGPVRYGDGFRGRSEQGPRGRPEQRLTVKDVSGNVIDLELPVASVADEVVEEAELEVANCPPDRRRDPGLASSVRNRAGRFAAGTTRSRR